MSRRMLAAVLVLALLGSGCAMRAIEAPDVALEQARAESRAACVRARADADQARMQTIANMDPGSQGYALMADAMARQAEALGGKDPCAAGMGAYEARVAEVQSRNAVVQSLGGKLISGSIIGAGIWTAGRIAEKGIEQAGDKVSQTATEGSSITYTQERVTSNADISNRALGEGSNAQTTAPSVSGPDKSSHTVVEAPEPVEPEIEEPEVEAAEAIEPEPIEVAE